MRLRFDTEALEPRARFESFRDQLVRRLFQLDLVSRGSEPYRGAIDLDVTGPVVFGRVFGSPADFFRSQSVARRCEDGVWLLLARRGRMGVGQDDVSAILSPGEGIVYDAERPHEGHCLDLSDTWVIQVRYDFIASLRAGREGPLTRLLDRNSGHYASMITAMLEANFRSADPEDARASEIFGRYLGDLVALLLDPSRDGKEQIAVRGLKAARRVSVLEQIEGRAIDPDFSAAVVARELGVTRRYVDQLLEETGRTFSERVLKRRLVVAHAMLTNPALNSRSITSIALDCGFSDVSYFNRAYRRHYGMTPSDTRRVSR